MKRLFILVILVFIKCVTIYSACFAWEKSSPGTNELLEAQGTTLIGRTEEKVLYSYTIRPGDTLWDIAKWALHDPFLWPEMLKYNFIQNPDLIYPGVKLTIPSPEVLERLKNVQDADAIQKIREESEKGAAIKVLISPEKEVQSSSITAFADFEEQGLITPMQESEPNSAEATALEIKGRKNITFRYRHSQGNRSGQYYSEGYNRQESLDLTINGKLNDSIKVKGQFYQSDQSLEEKYSLLFTHEKGTLFVGDFNASLPESTLVLDNRQLTGGRLDLNLDQWGLTLLAGAGRGTPHYERFFGNRTQGPYYLKNSQVVEGSEQVRVDKQVMVKGTDYRMDYFSGSITFLSRVIDDVTQVEVLYESKQSALNGTLAAARGWIKPVSSLMVAAAAAYDHGQPSDNTSNTPNAYRHLVLSSALQWAPPAWGKATLDWALSRYLLAGPEDIHLGQIIKSTVESTVGPARIKGHYERATPEYRMIGGLDQGQDQLLYGGQVDMKLGPAMNLAGDWDFKDVVLDQHRETTIQGSAKAEAAFRQWPRLTYLYYQLYDHNVDPELLKDYTTRRHTGTVGYGQAFWDATLQAETELREGQLSDRPGAQSRKLSLALGSKNLSWLNVNGLYDVAVVAPDANSTSAQGPYQTQSLVLTGAWTPSDRYQWSVDNRWVWDEAYGSTRTLNSKVKLAPVDQTQLTGNYTWETLDQLIGATSQAVAIQTAAGQLDLRPWPVLVMTIMPNWRWSVTAADGRPVNQSEQDVAQLKWAMGSALSHELEARKDHNTMMDLSDVPVKLQSEQQTGTGTYKLNMALSSHLSGSVGVRYEESQKSNYNPADSAYDTSHGRVRALEADLRSSPADAWRLDAKANVTIKEQYGSSPEALTRTAYPISSSTQAIETIDQLNNYGSFLTRSDHGELKVTYKLSQWLSSYASGLLDINRNLRQTEDVIYTASPGLGLTMRWASFNLEAAAKLAKSWGQVSTHQESYTLTLNAQVVKMLALQLRGEHTLTRDPDSVLTDVVLSCNISF